MKFGIKKVKNEIVQKNDLTRFGIYKNLTVNDLKLFKLIISKINNNDTLFSEFYTITYSEIDFIGLPSKDRFKTILDSLKRLSSYFIELSKDKRIIYLGLIKNKFIFERYTNKIVVSLDEDLQEYLLQLKNHYFKYSIENIVGLTTKSEIKLYEFVMSFINTHHSVEIDILELRDILEIDNGKFPLYGNIKQKILVPSIEKINKKTNIFIVLSEKKVGKRVENIKFVFSLK